MFSVCSSGGLGLLASVPIDDQGHGSSADDRASEKAGSVLRISDPFAATP
jgi:hypothetical protein